MLFYKLTTFALLAVMVYLVFDLRQIGKRLRQSRESGGHYDERIVSEHRSIIACLGCITFVVVSLIELQVRMSPDPYAVNPWLFGLHLTIDVLFLAIGAVMVSRFTGKYRPHWHRRLAYSLFTLFFASIVTGSWMLVRLPT
ncbi:MAG: hypothetical protein P4L81_02290 [Candidatus Pacebacteria bacterium]|nr:hypothetical protein [Candidatus Paceibacterota bacterium]